MPLIADLHIHSPYSRATSPQGTLPGLYAWARVKGVDVVGTGDCTHPGWLAHLREHLVPAEPGLFRLRDERVPPALPGVEPRPRAVRFLLTGEISSIYKRDGRVRKVHNVVFAPDFDALARFTARLAAIGNIESDGRPILGLDARHLLEIVLETMPDGFLVPAHIWTPWFSLFGSKSGFDSVEECFGDLTPHIFALETGLSSDPQMNRLVSALDRYTLISNSDCHSPAKLAREANLFHTPLDYFALRDALRDPRRGFAGTIEFFPEEGKYHLDGHRACAVRLDPAETRRAGLLCPVCGKPVTVGVMHRVLELADRDQPLFAPDAPAVHSLVPLPEVLGELLEAGPESKRVQEAYGQVVRTFGSELDLLLEAEADAIAHHHSPVLAEAIRRMRAGRVIRQSGYDGEYGTIRLFDPDERRELLGQRSLFAAAPAAARERPEHQRPAAPAAPPAATAAKPERAPNKEQAAAIDHRGGHLLVSAGPGTGKTFTLVARLARLIADGEADPTRMVAITFTRRAAGELRERLSAAVGERADGVFVGTFHAFALHWLRQAHPLTVVGEQERERLLRHLFPPLTAGRRADLEGEIAAWLDGLSTAADPPAQPTAEVAHYLAALEQARAIDLEAVIPTFVARLEQDARWQQRLARAVQWLFVDEFQDLNAAQYRLVALLARHARVFAIGDPHQAIYGFRGADWRYFPRFAEEFGATTLALIRNYRSSRPILDAALAVIAHNGGEPPALRPQRKGGGPLEYFAAATAVEEARWVAARVEQLLGGTSHRSVNEEAGYGLRDVAVLYRLNSEAEPLREALERRGLPVQQVGVTPFFARAALRPAYHFLRAAADPAALDHIPLLAGLPGVGSATLRRVEEALPLTFEDFFITLAPLASQLPARAKLKELEQALERMRQCAAADGLAPALTEALTFLAIDPTAPQPRRLVELAGAFGRDLAAFADHLEQQSQATVYDPRAEAVALMTLHAAKGLEFPVVFIAGLEEGLIPCRVPGLQSPLDEERRLFYVGLTRARERLVLTSAAERTLMGQSRRQNPSRFLGEISEGLVQRVTAKGKGQRGRQLGLF